MVLTATQAERFFDESFYLNNNPDVGDAVNDGVFSTGLQHFLAFGLEEGRAPNEAILESFTPEAYLDENSDIASAVEDGVFESALDHFLTFGAGETRPGAGFESFFSAFVRLLAS